MEFTWDPRKAEANRTKHGVEFETVSSFDWTNALIEEDTRFAYGERRFYALGEVDGRVHAVIFTRRGTAIRLISFRKANDREIRRYENR
ncbi:MAG TPA: BrnT family toxin [Bauldia sp.]|nr:BrnT family toxin [Bauldia sp.]